MVSSYQWSHRKDPRESVETINFRQFVRTLARFKRTPKTHRCEMNTQEKKIDCESYVYTKSIARCVLYCASLVSRPVLISWGLCGNEIDFSELTFQTARVLTCCVIEYMYMYDDLRTCS